jgi:hypothetical protein
LRYYNIITSGGASWSSVVNGSNLPGALDIDFDIELSSAVSTGSLTIRGIDQQQISQATVFTGQTVQLYAGFTDGLPLATDQFPHQGLIAHGQIWPSFGNWTGNDLSLSFIIKPGGPAGGPTDVKNIIHNMPKDSLLSDAIKNALTTAFPASKFLISISDSLKLNEPDQGFYQGMDQYQNYVKSLSHSILGTPSVSGYQGVQFLATGYNQYVVTDFTKTGGTIAIQFEDLVGQPCWIGFNTIQVKTVLRADLNAAISAMGHVDITLPNPLLVNTSVSGAYTLRPSPTTGMNQYEHGNILTFTGTWKVIKIRHIGHLRQPTGEAWVTVIDAVANVSLGTGSALASTGGIQTFMPITSF